LAYLFPSDVNDARALWVDPAGLGRGQEASLHADLTIGDPGTDARLRQLTFGFNSRGLSFGYQRDVLDSGGLGHTYRLGMGAGRGGLAAGLAAATYRGNTKGTGWDFGVEYAPAPIVTLGVVLGNVGQPVVRGVRQMATLVPNLSLKPFGPLVAISAEGRITTDSVLGYAAGVRFQAGGGVPLGLLVRFDADHAFHRTALVFGVSFGGRQLLGSAASIPSSANRVDPANIYGIIARRPEH
jgi:hypothetical protein